MEKKVTTRSGRIVRPPSRLMELTNLIIMHHERTWCVLIMEISALKTYCKEMEDMEYMQSKEFAYIGAGIGGGFKNTRDKHMMKYKEKWRPNKNMIGKRK